MLYILRGLRRLNNLKKIKLDFCALQDDIGGHFKKFFERNTSLEELELGGNQLGAQVCNDIGVSLRKFGGELKYLGNFL